MEKSKFKLLEKPWGQEEWLESTSEHKKFLVKKITINKGYRTSAHVHKEKIETTYIIQGKVRVWTAWKEQVVKNAELVGELIPSDFGPGDTFDIYPGLVHRLEALEDVIFIEVTTYHPNDVERFADDWNRI